MWVRLLSPLQKYKDLLNEQTELKPIDELQNMGWRITWWQKTQLKSRYIKDKKEGFQKTKLKFDEIICGSERKLLSKVYNALMEIKLEKEGVKEVMIKWAKNLEGPIMLKEWEKIWMTNIKMTKAASLKENLYKMFYRWHMTPIRIAKMSPNIAKLFWKCQITEGTFFHIWWQCKKKG